MSFPDVLVTLTSGTMMPGTWAWTTHHAHDVSELTRRAGAHFGVDVERLSLAALLHDVGKVAVPDAVLAKPAPLTEDERALVRRHSDHGAAMLAAVAELADLAPVVRAVHERWDGSGYPDGLMGEQIPLGARIIAVCDTYDALTSDRPYRAAVGHDEAVAELRRVAGAQLDPQCVEVLCEVLAKPGSRSPEVCR